MKDERPQRSDKCLYNNIIAMGSFCTAIHIYSTRINHSPHVYVYYADSERNDNSLSKFETVIITAVVCVVCSFIIGLLIGVLLTRCNVRRHSRPRSGQTERRPSEKRHVYEDIQPKKDIKLQHNEAYGHLPH